MTDPWNDNDKETIETLTAEDPAPEDPTPPALRPAPPAPESAPEARVSGPTGIPYTEGGSVIRCRECTAVWPATTAEDTFQHTLGHAHDKLRIEVPGKLAVNFDLVRYEEPKAAGAEPPATPAQ